MSYLLVVLITMTILSTVTVSLNMVVGYTGQPNLGQSAVFGIGAYFAAVFATSYSMPFWFCFVAAGLAAGIAGALIGAISLRLHQDFFAITTLGLNFIVVATFQTLPFFGGATGLYGIPLPTIAGYELDYPGLAICSLLLLLCTVGVSLLVNRSWFGGILQAICEDETLAASLGAPVARYKSTIFVISSIFAGFAGCLYAYFLSTVSPQTFGFNDSVLFLAMLLIGGSATIRGAIFGAVLLTIIPELFRFASEYRMLIFGAVLVLVLRFHPQGLIGEDSLIARWTANIFAGKRARP
jgi:branched-chain amino acid transport system permease protein